MEEMHHVHLLWTYGSTLMGCLFLMLPDSASPAPSSPAPSTVCLLHITVFTSPYSHHCVRIFQKAQRKATTPLLIFTHITLPCLSIPLQLASPGSLLCFPVWLLSPPPKFRSSLFYLLRLPKLYYITHCYMYRVMNSSSSVTWSFAKYIVMTALLHFRKGAV